MKLIILTTFFALLFLSSAAHSGDIAYGTIKGIKVYDFPNDKVTKIFFNSDATHQKEASCQATARITHSLHSEPTLQSMQSLALAAYMGNKKIRAYSKINGSCEVELIAITDTFF